MKNVIFLSILLCIFTLHAKEIVPSDVFFKVKSLNTDLDLIRVELGSKKLVFNLPTISDVTPNEVFFQAMTLCEKSLRLKFEWTKESGKCPPLKMSYIQPNDVYEQVITSQKNIDAIKKYFNITHASVDNTTHLSKNSTDVFREILKANQQLNSLFRKRYTPDDVFKNVTKAIYYMHELMKSFPNIKQTIPKETAFQRGKTPREVYLNLVRGLEIIAEIKEISNKKSIKFEVNEKSLQNIVPSDVYDVATLLVSQLSYLYYNTGGKKIIQSYQPLQKTPSNVYQRSKLLNEQLHLLLEEVKNRPTWLRKDI